ncbi:MAG: polysaccharide pyruvyl transferase CsaB [Halanaerobiales bacterium]|nr:polysaccharide pyruvyl transferase CsaB [Halanaerobiales bacterium]
MERILISGYFGFNNLGDEAILNSMIRMIKELNPETKIIVLSNSPESTKDKYDTESIYRYDIFKIMSEMKRSDIFISGGGSLLQDVTSLRSVPYYLGLIFIAIIFKMKTIFFAQGVGPVQNKLFRFLIEKVLNKVDYLSVRDENSKMFLENIGIQKNKINIIDDPVFGLSNPNLEVGHRKKESDEVQNIGVSVRNWHSNRYLNSLVEFLNRLGKKNDITITIIPFHKGRDLKISKKLQNMLDVDSQVRRYTDVLDEVNEFYKTLDLFIGVRLHSLIFSAVNQIPFIGISYDPKTDSLIEEMGYQEKITTENITVDKLQKSYNKIINQENEIKNRIVEVVELKSTNIKSTLAQLITDLKGE